MMPRERMWAAFWRGFERGYLMTGSAIAVLAACALVASCCAGCGASAATRSAYALEQARCIANEREIIARRGTTEEEDTAAMAAERARCDAALDAIEVSDGR